MSDFGNGPPEKRRARTYFYALVGALSVVLVVVVPPPAKGAVIGLLITLVGGASGDTGRRFVVPLGVALFSYWITATARPYANFLRPAHRSFLCSSWRRSSSKEARYETL